MTMKFRSLLLSAVVSLLMSFAPSAAAQALGDTLVPLTGAMCPGSATAGTGVVYNGIPAVGTGLMVLTTPFAPVYQVQTTGAASTITFSCDIPCPMRSTLGKGCTSIAGLAVFYGVQTTAATSETAPVCGTVAFPVPAAAEAASTVAFVNQPVTALPVVGSANLGTTTAGAFFTQYISITTPGALPTAAGTIYQKIFCTWGFGQTGAAAQVINTPGGFAFTTNTITWLKRHGHDKSVDAMMHTGISHETAELIFAHYVPRDRKGQAYMAKYEARQRDGPVEARLGEQVTFGPTF